MNLARTASSPVRRMAVGPLLVAALCAALVCALPARADAAVAPPSVKAPAGLLRSFDGSTTLWGRRATQPRRAASTIKMLTALVVREKADLDDVVVVPRRAAAISDGDVGLIAGQRLTVRQLLNMMLVASANDAAEALAIHVGGSEARFVRMMNRKAWQIGLTRTRATDPHGLGKRETTTARDLTILAREVMNDPELARIVARRAVRVPVPGRRTRWVKSTDQLLGRYPGLLGVKTGFTRPAGYCFVSVASRRGVSLVGVVMGTPSNAARFAETRKLLDWGFAHYRRRTVVSTATAVAVPVAGGLETSVTARPVRPFVAVEFDADPFTVRTETATAAAPVALGQELGRIVVSRRGSVVAAIPLVAERGVDAAPAPEGASVSLWEAVTRIFRTVALVARPRGLPA